MTRPGHKCQFFLLILAFLWCKCSLFFRCLFACLGKSFKGLASKSNIMFVNCCLFINLFKNVSIHSAICGDYLSCYLLQGAHPKSFNSWNKIQSSKSLIAFDSSFLSFKTLIFLYCSRTINCSTRMSYWPNISLGAYVNKSAVSLSLYLSISLYLPFLES